MEQVLDFLRELSCNNDRAWFNAHKDQYKKAHDRFCAFALELLESVRRFDSAIGPLTIKDITYRIYRDIRFSSDKSPYKTHMGVIICPGGKKSGYSGYYFQVSGAQGESWTGSHMVAVGSYMLEPKVAAIIREDIENSGGEFRRILSLADSRFEMDWTDAWKGVPAGFPTDSLDSDYFRLKDFLISYIPDDSFVTAPDLVPRLTEMFRTAKPFLDFVNRAIGWSREEAR